MVTFHIKESIKVDENIYTSEVVIALPFDADDEEISKAVQTAKRIKSVYIGSGEKTVGVMKDKAETAFAESTEGESVEPATDKQMGYLKGLLREAEEMGIKVKLPDIENLDRAKVSQLIESLKAVIRKAKTNRSSRGQRKR
jgi:hypothetical protein